MPRQPGSKVVPCPKCDGKVVAMPSETGVCKNCGTKVKVTKKLLAELGK
jgi:hypothetical protein